MTIFIEQKSSLNLSALTEPEEPTLPPKLKIHHSPLSLQVLPQVEIPPYIRKLSCSPPSIVSIAPSPPNL
jgi:hypothetical protein